MLDYVCANCRTKHTGHAYARELHEGYVVKFCKRTCWELWVLTNPRTHEPRKVIWGNTT